MAFVLSGAFVFGCDDGSGVPSRSDADVEVEAEVDAEVDTPESSSWLPMLLPCPERWQEVPATDGDGLSKCEPWPDAAPAVFTPCPAGWTEVTSSSEGLVRCDPWPLRSPAECGEYEAHFPGDADCSPIGSACPDGNWAEDLPEAGDVLYVRAGAVSGGVGTREAPFGSITEAMSVAGSGTVIALSKGTFDELVDLRGGVTLWGACVAETLLTYTIDELETVGVMGSDTVVRNLRLSGRRSAIVASGAAYSVHIEDVVVEHAVIAGLLFQNNARATARNIIVRETRSMPGNRRFGRGMEVQEGAQVSMSRALFDGNLEAAIIVSNQDSALELEDVVVRDTRSDERSGTYGFGLNVLTGARAVVTRSVFEGNHGVGVGASSSGTAVSLDDVVIRDTLGQEADEVGGYGLEALDGAQLQASRVFLDRNRGAGIAADGAGTVIHLQDVAVLETLEQQSDGTEGVGMFVQEGAEALVQRAVFARNHTVGVRAVRSAVLTLEDVVIRETQSRVSDDGLGCGLVALEGTQVTLRRALFEENRTSAVFVGGSGTTLVLEDAVVRDTQSQESDQGFGRGLLVHDEAHASLQRVVFERNREIGLSAWLPGAVLEAENLLVTDTRPRDCVDTTCQGFGIGDGVASFAGAYVELSRFLINHNTRCGVQVAYGGVVGDDGEIVRFEEPSELTLHGGEVSFNVVGVNVQIVEFDMGSLTDNVRFRENDADFDTTNLPVPGMATIS